MRYIPTIFYAECLPVSKIFISYRRDDSADLAGRIDDRLAQRYGRDNVFKDVDSIPLGVDFRAVLNGAVGRCQVLLAVIGRDWLHITGASGGRRLDDPGDFVRLEIEAALQRGIPVIPVLVCGAAMPPTDQLPPPLQALVFRNGIAVRRDPDFHTDMNRLVKNLDQLLGGRSAPPAAPVLEPVGKPRPPKKKAVLDAHRPPKKTLAEKPPEPGKPSRSHGCGVMLAVASVLTLAVMVGFGMRRAGMFQPEGATHLESALDLKGTTQKQSLDLPGGEEQAVDLGDGLRMIFCWVPGGEAQMGSPKAERAEALRQIKEDKEPEWWLASEAEEVRGKFKTSGFWLAKYPVTQEQYRKLMPNNPSWFVPGEDQIKKENIQDTSRFPVENISWDDCRLYLKELNRPGRAPDAMGKGLFVLPHENEWEYAARGGKGNRQPYYFGGALKGDLANCDGNYPFGTDTTGDYKKRTTEVGSYQRQAPHPWGLCDMHGNVWQWCENKYNEDQDSRVLRGGSWLNYAWNCRAAFRSWNAPSTRSSYVGCRVAFRLD